MADISKITALDGQTYDLKDDTARAWCTPTTLTTTYTTNEYVDNTSFDRIRVYKTGGMYIVRINLNITKSIPASAEITIGSVSNYSSIGVIYQQIPNQKSDSSTILFSISATGEIKVANNSTSAATTGFYRAMSCVPAA